MAPRAYYKAVATLTGCIIGAGIFAIPFVVVRAGFWTGMLVILVLGLAMLLVNLLVGEISLRSKKCHQLVGYAEKYLGKPGKYAMTASMIVGVYGAMVAYTLGVSQSLAVVFGGPQWVWAAIFYAVMITLIHGGLQMLERSELWMEAVKYVVFVIIIFMLFSSRHFLTSRLTGFSWDNIFLPYGVILFAYAGTVVIPEVREEMKKCKLLTKRAIITGSLISLAAYALFATAVVGVSGGATTEVATIGLASLLGGGGYVLLHLFAIIAMASSFVAMGYAMKDMYRLDLKIPHGKAWALTVAIPVVLIILGGAHSFVRTLDIAGAFAGGMAGITLVLIHSQARKQSERKPEYQIKLPKVMYGVLILLFALGILYHVSLLL